MPPLPRAIWILAAGRLLSQLGNGFVLFYAPIFFVNQVGLSATLVGLGLGSAQQSTGILGRVLGGTMSDSPKWGRRRTLLLSAAVSAIADVALLLAGNFPLFLLGNLLMGLGIGLYWPATEAAIADLAPADRRNEAFAITRLADSIGLSLGTACGGLLLASAIDGRWLFIVDGISFVAFFVVIYFAIAETFHFEGHDAELPWWQTWREAFSDLRLQIYIAVNILFTAFISQTQTTLPLYLRNFVPGLQDLSLSDWLAGIFGGDLNLSVDGIVGILFSGHILLMVLIQLPVARWLNRFRHCQALMFAQICWGLGFIPVWLAGTQADLALPGAIAALACFSLAIVAYTPAASTLVIEIAPTRLRGVYLAINSLCWAVGYFIGPPLGGWALDRDVRDLFWVGCAIAPLLGIAVLSWLDRLVVQRERV